MLSSVSGITMPSPGYQKGTPHHHGMQWSYRPSCDPGQGRSPGARLNSLPLHGGGKAKIPASHSVGLGCAPASRKKGQGLTGVLTASLLDGQHRQAWLDVTPSRASQQHPDSAGSNPGFMLPNPVPTEPFPPPTCPLRQRDLKRIQPPDFTG